MRTRIGCRVWAWLAAAAVVPTPAPGETLSPATPVTVEIQGGAPHVFVVPVRAGDRLLVAAEPEGADVAVAVIDPAGATLLEVDDTGGTGGGMPETAFWVAEAAGDHRVEVRLRPPQAGARCRVWLEEPRPATPDDRARASAVRGLSAAARLKEESKAESRRAATAEYERVRAAFRALGERRGEALAATGLGETALLLADFEGAKRHLEEAVAAWRDLGDRWQEGRALAGVGQALLSQSRNDAAVPVLTQAQFAFHDTGDRRGEARTLSDLGVAHQGLGDEAVAARSYEEALPVLRELGDRQGEAGALANLGILRWQAGAGQVALDLLLEALAAGRAAGDRSAESVVLYTIGGIYSELGDTQRAVIHLEQALALARETGDRRSEAATQGGIGYAHGRSGDFPKALAAYQSGLELSRAQGDKVREAIALANLGRVEMEAGGRPAASLQRIDEALVLLRAQGERVAQSWVLATKVRVLIAAGDLEAARTSGHEALRLSEQLDLGRFKIVTLHQLARVEHARGDLAEAERHIRAAIGHLESLRRPLRSADLRASYIASVRSFYDLHVHVLMTRHAAEPTAGFDVLAFEAAERGRARSLLDLLAESRADVRQGIDPDLLARERSLRERLSAAGVRTLRARAQGAEAEKAVAREIEGLTTELEAVEAEIRARSPRYAALMLPRPTTVADVQAGLDDQTQLLAYSIGEDGSHAWLIGQGSLHTVALPSRSLTDAAARRALASMESDAGGPEAAAELSRLVLGGLGERLTARRLVIVADGALQYVPFAALPHPRHGRTLVESIEVVGLPSASTLALLRGDRAGRSSPGKTIAVLADPVFDAGDERLTGKGGPSTAAATGSLTRATEAVGLAGPIPRLPFTRREAQAILAAVPPGSALAALDFDASREMATGPKLESYRVVHFATHGFLNAARPELSGILLSLFDREGRPQSGFVTTADAFNLKLSADLVVLSGCRTALGKEMRGEGIVGLTRGFMYAGADRVMASLWKVDDAATAALMTRFYQAMLGPRKLPPAAALRAAQLDLRRQDRYRHPYYWAGFQVLGGWD